MNEAKFSLTIKVDGDLFTVRGDTAQEFAENANAAAGVITAVKALQQASNGSVGNLQAVQATEVALPQAPQSSDNYDGFEFDRYTCKHGKRVFKEGTNKKTGKPYAGYFCSHTVISEACTPVWGR